MNGAVLKEKVGAFRVLPHHARYEPIELPDNIHDLIDLSPTQLENMVDNEEIDNDLVFDGMPKLKEPVYDEEWNEPEEVSNGDVSGSDTKEDILNRPRMTRAQKRMITAY